MTLTRYLLLGAGIAILAWGAYSVMPVRNSGNISTTAVSKIDSTTYSDNVKPDFGRAQSPVTSAPETNISSSRLARLEAEVARVQQQLQAQTVRLEELFAPINDAEPSTVEMSPEEYALAQAQEEEEAEQERFARLEFIETSLQTEQIDSEWSDQTSVAIKQTFNSQELAAAEVSNIDCRATLCRVDVHHDNQEKLTAFQSWFPLKVAESLPRLTMDHSEEGEDRFSTVVYLARDGYELPTPATER